jgi:branched-subunit amino acid transport protein AzlD
MISTTQAILIVAAASIGTFVTRAVPFFLFGGKKGMPSSIQYLGDVLPPAIIAILIIYCLKNLIPVHFPKGCAELISIAGVAILHMWKRNVLLSVAGGTILYMLLIRLVF